MSSSADSNKSQQNWWVSVVFMGLLVAVLLGGAMHIGAQRERERVLRGVVAQELIVIGTMRLSHQSSGQPPDDIISDELTSDINDICHKNKEFLLEIRDTDASKSYLVRDFLEMCEGLDVGISRGELTFRKVFDVSLLMSKAVSANISSDANERTTRKLTPE
jgi:hypothetical protein